MGERQAPETGQLRQVVRLLESMSGSVEQVRVTAVGRPGSQTTPSVSAEPAVAKATSGVTEAVSRPETGSAAKADSIPLSTVSTPEEGAGSGAALSPGMQVKPVAASGYSVLREYVGCFQAAVKPSPPLPVFAYHRTQAVPAPIVPQGHPSVSTAGAQDSQPVDPYRAMAEISSVPQSQRAALDIPSVQQMSVSASTGMEKVSLPGTVNAQAGTSAQQPIQPWDATISSEASAEAKMDRTPNARAIDVVAGGNEPVVKSDLSVTQARPQSVSFESGVAQASVDTGTEEGSMPFIRKVASTQPPEVSRVAATDLPRSAEVRGAMNAGASARPSESVLPFRQPVAVGQSPIPANAAQSEGIRSGAVQAVVASPEPEASPMAQEQIAQPLTMRKPGSTSGESVKEPQSTVPASERPIASAEQSNAKDLPDSSELRMPRTEKPEGNSERSFPSRKLQPVTTQRSEASASRKSVKLDPERVSEALEAARRESVRGAVQSGSSERSALANNPAPQRFSGRSVEMVAPAERESEPVAETSEKGADRTFEVERSREEWRPQTEPQREKAVDSAPRARSEWTVTPRAEAIHSRPDAAGAPAPMPGASSAVSAARELAQMERIATALDEQRTIMQVAGESMTQADSNPGDIRGQLEPDQLGRLRMQIGVEDGVVRARIVTETGEARALLERHLPELKIALGEQGLRVQEVRLISAGSGEQALSGFEGQSHSYRHGGTGTQQEQRQAWANDSSSWTPDRQPKQEQSRPYPDRWRNRAGSGRVDYRA
jgi:flagellar hook-length control protein FliK